MLRHGTMPWQTVESNITRQSLNYTATGLMPFTVYEFRMKSYTAIGQSVYSAVVSARTLEDGEFFISISLDSTFIAKVFIESDHHVNSQR